MRPCTTERTDNMSLTARISAAALTGITALMLSACTEVQTQNSSAAATGIDAGLATSPLFAAPGQITPNVVPVSQVPVNVTASVPVIPAGTDSTAVSLLSSQFTAQGVPTQSIGQITVPAAAPVQPAVSPQPAPVVRTASAPRPGRQIDGWVLPSRQFTASRDQVGRPGNMICALTFDDGPHPKYDPQILDILERKGVKATFFVTGKRARANPSTLKQIQARGHEIGPHSWDHKDLNRLSASALRKDFERTNAELLKSGIRPRVFRPPYGNANSRVIGQARTLGMDTVRWTVDSLDWKRRGVATTTQTVLSQLKPGANVLLHSIHGQTVQALPGIIDGMRSRGCRFVTTSEWISRIS